MSPQKQLSNFIDTLLLAYILGNNSETTVKEDIIKDYKKLNDKCDSIISKIEERKSKT